MDQQNNTAALNDTAGVLPMDTGATVNGIHDEGDHYPSANAGAKKGRGRPPKSAGSTKANNTAGPKKANITAGSNTSDAAKRARGRPSKTGETATPIKKVVAVAVAVPNKQKEETATNGDAIKKGRGRPAKTSTPNEQSNVISKPKVQPIPVINHQEQENADESTKKKRGRPSGTSPKKAVVAVSSPTPKEASPTKKRGRPSGSAAAKKPAAKPKAPASANDLAKKRGRPKKSPTEAAAGPTPVNETATVTPNNVQ